MKNVIYFILILLILFMVICLRKAQGSIMEEDIFETPASRPVPSLKEKILVGEAIKRFEKGRMVYLRKMGLVFAADTFDQLPLPIQLEYQEIMDRLEKIRSIREVKYTVLPSYLDQTTEQMKEFLEKLNKYIDD